VSTAVDRLPANSSGVHEIEPVVGLLIALGVIGKLLPRKQGRAPPGKNSETMPDEQRRVREAMAKANGDPAVRAAREAAAAAQRKAIEIAEDVARQADPSIAPLFEKMRKAGEPRRPQGDNRRDRKQPE